MNFDTRYVSESSVLAELACLRYCSPWFLSVTLVGIKKP
jgi:hypothetical protein